MSPARMSQTPKRTSTRLSTVMRTSLAQAIKASRTKALGTKAQNPQARLRQPIETTRPEASKTKKPQPGLSDITNDGNSTLPAYEEWRYTWHNCDQCGNVIRCSFRTPQGQNDDVENDDGA